MSKFWNNYGSTILLLAGVAVGATAGLLFGEGVNVVKPVGDVFLNFIFVLVVPLVFFSISSSIFKLQGGGKAGRVLITTVAVFAAMLTIAGIIAYLVNLVIDPLGGADVSELAAALPSYEDIHPMAGADAIVRSISVPDLGDLLTKANLLPLILFSILTGYAASLAGEKGIPFANLLESGMEVTMKMMHMIMKVAPLGLGCYFAVTVASFGAGLLSGYLRITIVYYILAFAFFAVVNPAYLLLSGGWKSVKAYWQNILPPSITAFSSCSSAAAIPGNLEAAAGMGISPDVAKAVIPFGTNIHKDGSIIAGVFKVVFLMLLFGQSIAGPGEAVHIIGVALLASMVMGAVTGGGMTGELLTCTLLGLDPSLAGIIVIFGTIVDMPSTLVNSSANVVAAALVDRLSGRKKQ